MRCRDIKEMLDLYCGEELAPPLRDRVDGHLSGCDTCQRELERLRRLRSMLVSDDAPPLPDGFTAKVVEWAKEECKQAAGGRIESVGSHVGSESHRRLASLGQNIRIAFAALAALAAGLFLGGFLGFETWSGGNQAVAVDANNTFTEAGLGQLLESGGGSLAQSYLSLTLENSVEGN